MNPAPRQEPCIVRTLNGVVTLDNGLQFTQPIHGGFPFPQICESPMRNTTETSRVALRAEPNPKLWVRPWRASATDDFQTVASKILAVARKFTGDEKLNIIAPVPKMKLDERCVN